jgi:hypothetical protein
MFFNETVNSTRRLRESSDAIPRLFMLHARLDAIPRGQKRASSIRWFFTKKFMTETARSVENR